MTQQFSVSFLSPTQVGSQVAAFLTPISHPPTPVFFGHPSVLAVVALFGALLIAGCVGCAMFAARLGTVESLATAGTGVMVTGGPILVITLFLTQRIFVPVPSRYGLSLMPLLVSVLARSLRSSWWLVPAAVLAVASLIVTVVALVGAT